MKLRIIKTTPERLVHLLQGKTSNTNLPNDAEILDVKMDLFAKQVSIIVRSESFEDVSESMPIPEFNLSGGNVPATTDAKIASKPALTVSKPEAKVEPKTSVAKIVPPQPDANRWAAKMENEFSPDQRKLISFTVKGGVIVVKPTSFLKAEWEDINEVVRSLGGKWVKGDIISYWEIPLQ
jgi:hypothetical protein